MYFVWLIIQVTCFPDKHNHLSTLTIINISLLLVCYWLYIVSIVLVIAWKLFLATCKVCSPSSAFKPGILYKCATNFLKLLLSVILVRVCVCLCVCALLRLILFHGKPFYIVITKKQALQILCHGVMTHGMEHKITLEEVYLKIRLCY